MNKSSELVSNSSPDLSILIASREGNLAEVADSLRSGANVNTRDEQRRTPLMLGTIGGHAHIVGALLNANAQRDLQDRKGRTALMHASKSMGALMKSATQIALLLSRDDVAANPNIKNKKGRTALQYAIDSHNLDLIRLLIRMGADPDETDADGFTLTRHFLSERDVVPGVRSKRIEIANLLTECGGKGKDEDEFIKAIKAEAVDRVRVLLDRGVDANTRHINGCTALMVAAERGFTSIASVLLDKGADREARDKSGLTAIMHSRPLLSWFRPSARAQVKACGDDERRADLYRDAELRRRGEEQANTVRLLASKGADVDALDSSGNTTLMQAAVDMFPYDVSVVRALLEQNANVHVKDPHGRNALALAILVGGGNAEIIEALLRKNADPNSTLPTSDLSEEQTESNDANLAGMSVLIWAAMFEREDIVTLLLNAGADVNHRLANGLTALHFAALRGCTQIVKQLVSKGADLRKYGLEALALGSKSGAIAQYLTDSGVDPDRVDPKLIEGGARGTIDTATMTRKIEGSLRSVRAIDRYATGERAKFVSGKLPGQGKRR
ncbi:MAG TPA: ankyrin repeat domain-containing protein [Blastocatellia bacterium]|nr:ankyrin repeat domain-containing protein [Blastocatellia bacterium]